MSQLKEDVINKVLEDKMKDDNFKNIFLTFHGKIEYLRNFIISTVNNKFLKYDITKEVSLVNTKTELVKIISQKIKDKINESINKKKKELERISSFLNDFKNKIMKESKEKFEEEKNAFNEEEKKTNYNKQMDNIKKEQNSLIEKHNQQQTTYLENKKKEENTQIQEVQNDINNDFTNYQEKANSYNNMVNEQNNGKEIDVEKMKKLKSEIDSLTKTIQKKNDEFPNKVKDIQAKAKEEIDQKLGELKLNFDKENEKLQKKMEDLNNNYKKEFEEHNKKLKNLSDLSEKALKLNNDNFDIDENGVKIKDEELSNNPVYQNVLTNVNKDFSKNFEEFNDFMNNDYAGIVSDQVTKMEDKINLEQEEERENKINNFGRGMGAGDNNNPVYKCGVLDYEYNSKDMKIIGKQILGNDFDYFIDCDKKDLKEKIKNKKTVIGNYQDTEQKIWNTVCMIPDRDRYIILYKNNKGNKYNNNFEKFLDSIGIEKREIKWNSKDQSNDCDNSSCIFSLKNLEIFAEYLKNDKNSLINDFETIPFKSFSKEDIENIRINDFVGLYLKNIYQMIKNENGNKPIENFLEIIDPCINNENEVNMMEYFYIMYKAIKPFIGKDEKKKFKAFIIKHRKEKIKYN